MVISSFLKARLMYILKNYIIVGIFSVWCLNVYKHTMILSEGIQTEIMSMQCKTGPINSKLREPRGKCSRIVRPFALFSLQQTSGFAENNPFWQFSTFFSSRHPSYKKKPDLHGPSCVIFVCSFKGTNHKSLYCAHPQERQVTERESWHKGGMKTVGLSRICLVWGHVRQG